MARGAALRGPFLLPAPGSSMLKHSAALPDLHAHARECEANSVETRVDVTPCLSLSSSFSEGDRSSGTSVAFPPSAIFCHSLPGPIPWTRWLLQERRC